MNKVRDHAFVHCDWSITWETPAASFTADSQMLDACRKNFDVFESSNVSSEPTFQPISARQTLAKRRGMFGSSPEMGYM